MADLPGIDIDHRVDVVAVHGVETHSEAVLDDVVVLEVPSEGVQAEPVHQRHESAGPVGDVHVQGVDTVGRERRGPTFDSFGNPAKPRGVDDANPCEVASGGQGVLDPVETEPQEGEIEFVFPRDGDDECGGPVVLDVDAEWARVFDGVEKFLERGDVPRQVAKIDAGNRDLPSQSPHDAVVIEDDPSVARDPGVGLESIGSETQSEIECLEGVFPLMRPRTPVGKANRVVRQGWKSLLHHRRIGRPSYAGEVFNLSGSEIVFLLIAGLVVLGPERLPGVIRRVGRTYGEVRRTLSEYEREFRETFKEPLDEVRSTVNDFKSSFGTVDPVPSPPMRPEKSADPGDSTDAAAAESSPFSNATMSASPDRWRDQAKAEDGSTSTEGESDDSVGNEGAGEKGAAQ